MTVLPCPPRCVWIIFSHTHTGMGRIIRTFTGGEYNHVSVCLDGDLEQVYSFARYQVNAPLAGGFVHESPERLLDGGLDTPVEIYAVPLSGARYGFIRQRISQCCEMKRGRLLYNSFGAALSVLGLRLRLPNAYTCLDFAAELLGEGAVCTIPELRQKLTPYFAYQGGLRALCLPILRRRKLMDPYFSPYSHPRILWETFCHFARLTLRFSLLLSLFF